MPAPKKPETRRLAARPSQATERNAIAGIGKLRKAKFKMRMWFFDSAINKIAGKAPMYYGVKDVQRVIRRGKYVMKNYADILEQPEFLIEKTTLREIVEKYEKELADRNSIG